MDVEKWLADDVNAFIVRQRYRNPEVKKVQHTPHTLSRLLRTCGMWYV